MTADWQMIGHANVIENLSRSVETPSHAYLFIGPRQVGKTTAAVRMAMALNCLAETVERPCFACSECRLIEKQGHPDVTVLEPNEKDNLLTDQARRLRQEVILRPNQARWKVAILPADKLVESAADALLKTLEDPPESNVFILTGHDMDAIPETVVSRCRMYVFGLTSEEDIAAALREREYDAGQAAELAALSYGAPGWALTASKEPHLAEARKATRDDLERWVSGTLLDRLAAAEALGSGRKLEQTRAAALAELELMMMWWRDVLVSTAGRPDLVVNTSALGAIERMARKNDVEQTMRVLRGISTAATRVVENVEPRLSFEALAAATDGA